MAFRGARRAPQFADLKAVLAQSKETDNSLYQVLQELIDRLSTFQFDVLASVGGTGAGGGGNPNATYHTKTNEVATLPQSVQLLAGSGITFDDSVANRRTVSSTGVPGVPGPPGATGPAGPAGPIGPSPALLETFLTAAAEPSLANSRKLEAGTNVTFDLATPGLLKINASGSGGGMNLDYLGDYASGPTYNDGDIVIGADGIAYMCVVDGTVTPPEPWPGIGIISSQGPPGPAGVGFMIGAIIMWMSDTIPAKWLNLNGQAVSRTTYSVLFAMYGIVHGAGDGSTTFNLPDFRKRVPVGKDTGLTLGQKGGAWDHTHSVTAHSHPVGTLAGSSHTHSNGTLAVGSHTHDQGSLAVASHSHGPGNLRTESHNHGFSGDCDGTTNSDGNHNHSFSGTTGGNDASVDVQRLTSSGWNVPSNGHGHPFSGTTGSNGNHSHSFSGSVSGTTDGDAGLFVTVGATAAASSALTGSTGAASPGLSGATGGQTVPITGATGNNTPTPTDANNQAFIVVNYIVLAEL